MFLRLDHLADSHPSAHLSIHHSVRADHQQSFRLGREQALRLEAGGEETWLQLLLVVGEECQSGEVHIFVEGVLPVFRAMPMHPLVEEVVPWAGVAEVEGVAS